MQSTHTCELDIPHLPQSARQAHMFDELASGSLLSIGQLCDARCTATFDKKKLNIFFQGKIIVQGTRQQNKLWTMDTPVTQHHSLNSVVDAPTIAERIKFYHASLFSPTMTTLENIIKEGYLVTFPYITTKQLRQFPPNLKSTVKGHMYATKGNRNKKKLATLLRTEIHTASNISEHNTPPISPMP